MSSPLDSRLVLELVAQWADIATTFVLRRVQRHTLTRPLTIAASVALRRAWRRWRAHRSLTRREALRLRAPTRRNTWARRRRDDDAPILWIPLD